MALQAPKNHIVTAAALMVVLAGLKAATPILLPFLLSMFIAIVCAPIVRMMKKVGIPSVIAVMLVIILIVGTLLGLAGVVGHSLNEFRTSIPEYRDQIIEQLGSLVIFAKRFDIDISMHMVTQYFDPSLVFGLFANTLSGFGSIATNAFMILMVSIFMLLEADTMPKRVHVAIHDPSVRISQIDRFLSSVNSYMAVKTAISLITAIPITLILMWIGIEYAPMWGILAFLLNYIPNVGSLLAAIPPVLLAALQFGPSQALGVAGLYLGVNLVMGNIVEPRVMGKGLGLSSLVVILSLIFWGWLFGSVGMLLSVPLTMIVKIGLESSTDGHWLALLLSHPDELKEREFVEDMQSSDIIGANEEVASITDADSDSHLAAKVEPNSPA
ncbi:AI-2E family transporter [Alginatibacterium sediminis]|uniref:AI-2E family transporter n=1 Tax=Alginatibacterium sediminis TaxID=2164068 RepID=A0A420EA03_9ALTE|nr:AI-2E family transporter [Alginatibacterium sediminis]RKF17500.1 AI-2E family transporter [Alginatibacterium sediminis]